jgi:hypothetical protein
LFPREIAQHENPNRGSIDTAADAADASVADESESEDFTEAELDAISL